MRLEYPGISGMRIAFAPNLGNYVRIDRETGEQLANAAQRLSDLGAEVVEIDLDMGTTVDEMSGQFAKMLLSGSMGGWLSNYLDHLDDLTPYAAWFVGKLQAGGFGPEAAFEFENYMKALYARIADQVWNNGFDALVTSTLNSSHVPADHDHSLTTFEIDGETLPTLFIGSLTLPWNILNWCPVVAAPAGLTSQGMPVGLQIIGAPYHDHTVFQIAYAYEAASPVMFSGQLMPDFRGG